MCCVWKLVFWAAAATVCVAAGADPRVVEIDRFESWVSPYWGHSSPKVVFDGSAYYTAGIRGASPETAEGIIYKFDSAAWRKGATLPGIYQPATLLLDGSKRLIAIYNSSNQPMTILRAAHPGDIDTFDTLPAPDAPNGYYLGAAIRDDVVYLAYVSIPSYSMNLTWLDLSAGKWSTPVAIAEGQITTKPKTAWTYPILVPDAHGLHLCASNSPDGGEGNTYNIVWYLYFPKGAGTPSVRERVAETPVGHIAFATDMTVGPDGAVHIVYMWNSRKYGEPLPAGAPKEGLYHARRDPGTGRWNAAYLAPVCIAGFFDSGATLELITQEGGSLMQRLWDTAIMGWGQATSLLGPDRAMTPLSFMDTLSRSSGSIVPSGPALVTDGHPPDAPASQHLSWSVLPGL